MRIAKAAVATVIDCPEPVLTARFLQDAAAALHLPVETLTDDLATLRSDAAEAERRRAEFRARQEESARPAREPAPAAEPPAPIEADWEAEPEATAFDYPEDFAEPPAAPPLSALEASQNLAGALCELLAHHFHESEIMACLIRHLPPAFVHNPYASKLYDLAIAASLAQAPTLTPPDDDPPFRAYLATLFAEPDRLAAGGEDVTPLTYAHDLVRAYWVREYERRTRLLDPDSIEAFTLTQSRKRLQSLPWEAAAPFMDALNPNLAAPPRPAPDTPKAQAGPDFPEPDTPPPEETLPPEDTPPSIPPPEPSWEPDDAGDFYDTL